MSDSVLREFFTAIGSDYDEVLSRLLSEEIFLPRTL